MYVQHFFFTMQILLTLKEISVKTALPCCSTGFLPNYPRIKFTPLESLELGYVT